MNEIVSAWGDNSNGQLGDGSMEPHLVPTPVKGIEQAVRSVESGSGHVVVLLEDGSAVAWGRNAFGQVGDGTQEIQLLPQPVVGLTGIKKVVPGGGQTLYLMEDGTIFGAGGGFFGLLGADNMRLHAVPVRVDGIDEVVELISGGGHALALRADGTVWSWGRDDYGQRGDGPDADERIPTRATLSHAGRTYPARPTPTKIEGLSDIRSLAGGGGHSVAILNDGSV